MQIRGIGLGHRATVLESVNMHMKSASEVAMMSYGGTAETSFSPVRTLVAHDPALLNRVDAILNARGFTKLVTGDTVTSQHPRALAEAIHELKWLREYLQNVHNRADKFVPQAKPGPGRIAVIDDEDEELPSSEEDSANDGNANRVIIRSKGSDEHAPTISTATQIQNPTGNDSSFKSVTEFSNRDGSETTVVQQEYNHTSEESDGTSEEPEDRQAHKLSAISPRTEKEQQPSDNGSWEGQVETGRGSEDIADTTNSTKSLVEKSLTPAQLVESRLLNRKRHMLERENARKRQEQLRLLREQQKAREEHERNLWNRRKLEEKRQRAAQALLSQTAASDSSETDDVEIWCLCRKPAYGFMLACVNSKCPYEWFHGDCVGLDAAPKARWFCPICRPSYSFAIPPPVHASSTKKLIRNKQTPRNLGSNTGRLAHNRKNTRKPTKTRQQSATRGLKPEKQTTKKPIIQKRLLRNTSTQDNPQTSATRRGRPRKR